MLTRTIFPALPRRSRPAFAAALVVVVGLMLGSAMALWQASLIGLVGVGLLLVFVAYLWQTRGGVPVGVLVATALLGVVFGIGWAVATDAATAGTEDDALGLPVSAAKVLIVGLAIPLSFLLLLLAPMVLMRLWPRVVRRSSLDGYAIGALGALCFVAAGSLTRLAPQLAAGPVDDDGRSPLDLVIAGAIQGLAIPLAAAAVGGAVGATVWCTRRADSDRLRRWFAPSSPTPMLVFAIVIYLGLGLLDFFALPTAVETIVYAVVAVLALWALWIVLQRTLEAPSVGDTAAKPAVDDHGAHGRGMSAAVVVIAAAVVVMAGSAALSTWMTPPRALIVCPPDCGQPPISKPVATNPRFTPSTGEFSVAYPGQETAYEASFESNGVVLDLHAGDGGTLRLFGQAANGQTPRQIADALLRDHYPDATFAYEIPNAFVGYQLGYGEVADDYPADAIGDDGRNRVLIMVAVKNDYALIAAAAGPYREFSPDFGSGHPSGANFFLALDMAKYVNSFRWRGDPPR